MSIFDNFSNCLWFNPEYKRNTAFSMLAGILFFTGWWFWIDAMSIHSQNMNATYIILGILGTVSLFMVNSVTQSHLNGDNSFSNGCMEARGARIWIFCGFVLGFSAIIAAIWIMTVNFDPGQASNWPVISVLLQNIFIFLASLTFKFGRSEELWSNI